MKASKILSAFLILIALSLAVFTALLCAFAMTQEPMLIADPQGAASAAETVMESVRQGDYASAASVMQGKPDLGVNREPEDIVGKLLWQEFIRSFSYEKKGSCYAAEDGMALNMTVTYLDFNSVVNTLGDRAGELLEQQVKNAEDPSLLQDGEDHYRQELVDQVLTQAAKDAIAQDAKTITEDITVHMAFEDGKWWVIPESSLIHVISGGTAG